MKTTENKPVIIAEGKLVLTGRKFQYILQNGVKKFVWGKNCLKAICILMLSGFMLMSCTDNDLDALGESVRPAYINPELKPHVDAFISEAAKRGIYIQVNHLHLFWKKIGGNIAGKTWRYTWTIQIDRENSALDVRTVVFHEMGHLYLHREHDNRVYGPHNYPKSIMSSIDKPEYDADPKARQYYYDELFNPNTPLPDWIFH